MRNLGLFAALAALAAGAAGCNDQASGPVTKDKLDPLVRNRDLPLADQIKKIQEDKYIPAPEKERMVNLLNSQLKAQGH